MMSTLRLCVILRQFKCPQNIETTHQLLQQHINRGHNRLARMTGRDAPATHELRSSLRKRMFLLDHGPGSHMPAEKRFNHQGVKPIQKSQMNANQLKKLQQVTTNAKNNKQKGATSEFPHQRALPLPDL